MDTKTRNAIAHYTYFFENGKLFLCNGCFDHLPVKMELAEFVIESKNLNVLTESLFLIFLDKHFPGELKPLIN